MGCLVFGVWCLGAWVLGVWCFGVWAFRCFGVWVLGRLACLLACFLAFGRLGVLFRRWGLGFWSLGLDSSFRLVI